MIPMLNAAGFRAKLLTPEWATLWANVQVGKVPFYYMGRGGVVDPSLALSQRIFSGATSSCLVWRGTSITGPCRASEFLAGT